MIRFVGLLILFVISTPIPVATEVATDNECWDRWLVRVVYELPPDGHWGTAESGDMVFWTKEEAVAARQDILDHGWELKPPVPQESEVRVAPGAIKYASVKKLRCCPPKPPQWSNCEYVQAEPLPAP